MRSIRVFCAPLQQHLALRRTNAPQHEKHTASKRYEQERIGRNDEGVADSLRCCPIPHPARIVYSLSVALTGSSSGTMHTGLTDHGVGSDRCRRIRQSSRPAPRALLLEECAWTFSSSPQNWWRGGPAKSRSVSLIPHRPGSWSYKDWEGIGDLWGPHSFATVRPEIHS